MKKEVQSEFSTRYISLNEAKFRPRKYEILDSKVITEQAGYIPPKVQIENMILAGHRLSEYRREQFDFQSPDEIDESLYDPTRAKNFDLAEASQMGFEANQKIQDAKREALKASQTAQGASEGLPKEKTGGNEPPPEKGA